VTTASQLGLSRGLVKTDKSTIAPRVGVAWRLTEKSVLRCGYGVFYPTSAAQGIRDALESSPFNQGRRKRNTNPPLSGWPGFSHGFSPLTGGALDVVGAAPSANAVPFNLKSPRFENYNITFEQELGLKTAVRVSYLGTRMRRVIAGIDMNMLPPSSVPFGTSTGDGVTPCDPTADDCALTPAEVARRPFPELGDYLARYGNVGRGRSRALQIEANRRLASGVMFSASYTLLDQKLDALDTGNSALGGTLYNQFKPGLDFGRDAFISRHRFIAYGLWELPYGRGRHFGSAAPPWADYVVGGWQVSWNLFAKSGVGFTPFWTCDGCNVAFPGNIGSSFVNAIGNFGDLSFRPNVIGNPNRKIGDKMFDASAFAPPSVAADLFDNPQVAKRNLLTGPGAWGTNIGIQKNFRIKERVTMRVAAEFDNVFNHPLLAPDSDEFGNVDGFAHLGSFTLRVDPATLKLAPITEVTRNPNFGRRRGSFSQESIDSRRSIRVKLRLTF
jgi:hypothetical protein